MQRRKFELAAVHFETGKAPLMLYPERHPSRSEDYRRRLITQKAADLRALFETGDIKDFAGM